MESNHHIFARLRFYRSHEMSRGEFHCRKIQDSIVFDLEIIHVNVCEYHINISVDFHFILPILIHQPLSPFNLSFYKECRFTRVRYTRPKIVILESESGSQKKRTVPFSVLWQVRRGQFKLAIFLTLVNLRRTGCSIGCVEDRKHKT